MTTPVTTIAAAVSSVRPRCSPPKSAPRPSATTGFTNAVLVASGAGTVRRRWLNTE
jgi:hypothetical protein